MKEHYNFLTDTQKFVHLVVIQTARKFIQIHLLLLASRLWMRRGFGRVRIKIAIGSRRVIERRD
jgi:hypothetical protein